MTAPIASTPLALGAPLVSAIISIVANGKIIGDYLGRRRERERLAATALRLNDPATFSTRVFEVFLYGPLTIIITVAVLLELVVVALILWLAFEPSALPSLSDITVIRSAAVLFVLSLALLASWHLVEPALKLRFLPRRIRPWEAERIAAVRVKLEKAPFIVDPDQCESLAASLLAKLRVEPSWLFGTLLAEDGDQDALPNELLFGVLCEELGSKWFDPQWDRFSKLRESPEYRQPTYLLRPERLRQLTGANVAEKLGQFFVGQGFTFNTRLTGAVEGVADRLRKDYGGDASRLLRIAVPRGAILVGLALAIIAVWAMTGHVNEIHFMISGLRYTMNSEVAIIVAAALAVSHILISWRQWISFVLVRSGLWSMSDCVNWRLAQFPTFRTRPGTRTAFIKFVSEYGLLSENIGVEIFGDSTHVRLALVNSGAIHTADEKFVANDPDLKVYAQTALGVIAKHIDRLIDVEPYKSWRRELPYLGAESCSGQFLGVNIADGAMFLTGKDYCGQSEWNSPVQDCPAASICEVQRGTRFKFNDETLDFVRDPQP